MGITLSFSVGSIEKLNIIKICNDSIKVIK